MRPICHAVLTLTLMLLLPCKVVAQQRDAAASNLFGIEPGAYLSDSNCSTSRTRRG